MTYDYYYNNVPGEGLCRNNLVYTSLISRDKKVFVQHYVNDSKYHQGKNEVVDPKKMTEKWSRELCFLSHMSTHASDHVPKIIDINLREKKIYLEIDGVDFWQRSLDANCSFDGILPDWQDQMLNIIQKHKDLNLYKYSMHPSSYFIVDGKLKSINYFFCHSADEGNLIVKDYESHIYSARREQMRKYMEQLNISWDQPESQNVLQRLCFDSFGTTYPRDFIEKAKAIYND
jgi:hypothetical protein